MLFYQRGQFFSRGARHRAGMVTFHPQGIHHGARGRRAAERAATATRTDEIAP
ncbi:MAG: hypothetical protein HS111_33120 [Kofleriaceae bacterium]|nr:hypothetical protein [Kofleriaceae bacterium]